MVQRLTNFSSKSYLPRWIVFFFDIAVVLTTFIVAYILRFNFQLDPIGNYLDPEQLLLVLPVYLLVFLATKTHLGIIRHSTTRDITRIMFSLSIASSILLYVTYLFRKFGPEEIHIIPYSVIIIQFTLSS